MTDDELNDYQEGYADAMAGKLTARFGDADAYDAGWDDGADDAERLHNPRHYSYRKPRPLSLFWRIYLRIARIWA